MGVASADYVGPINRLQEALQRRANWEMHWHRGPDPDDPRSRLVDIIGGRLLLSHFPHYTKLTVIYETTSKPQDGRRERGRRVAGAGSIARMYAIAHDLATYGIRGGPAFTDGPWVWERVDEDSWQRMLVPDGELRLSAPERPDGKCSLIHDVGSYIELLAVAREADLEQAAPVIWEKRRTKPLRVIVDGREANLRSLDEVASLIGYHPVTDNTFVALVRSEDELALCYVDGMTCRGVKVSWERALSGEPFNVDELLQSAGRAGRGPTAANHGPAANEVFTERPTAQDRPPPGPEVSAPGISGARASCPPGCTPMSAPQRELCRRYLKRLHRRLRGRGARKARQLVLLILEAIEWCRHDLTGTRQEVNSALEQVLEQERLLRGCHARCPLPGGDRNIRDAMDLLVKRSLFAHLEDPQDTTRCTLVLSQFHDPNSELMRSIAADEAAELAAAAGVAGEHADVPLTPPSSGMTDAIQDRGLADPDPTPDEPPSTAPEPATATASAAPQTGSPTTAGSAQKSQTAGRRESAHVFHALVQGSARDQSRPFGKGDACVSRDAPIVAQPVNSRTNDTPLRGFTDRLKRTDSRIGLGPLNEWDTNHKKERRPDGSDDDSEPGD